MTSEIEIWLEINLLTLWWMKHQQSQRDCFFITTHWDILITIISFDHFKTEINFVNLILLWISRAKRMGIIEKVNDFYSSYRTGRLFLSRRHLISLWMWMQNSFFEIGEIVLEKFLLLKIKAKTFFLCSSYFILVAFTVLPWATLYRSNMEIDRMSVDLSYKSVKTESLLLFYLFVLHWYDHPEMIFIFLLAFIGMWPLDRMCGRRLLS